MSALAAVTLLLLGTTLGGPRKLPAEGDDQAPDRPRAGPLNDVPPAPGDAYDLCRCAPCGLHSLDAGGVFLEVNDVESEMLQVPREQLVGKRRFADFLSAPGKQRFAREFPTFKQTGRVEGLEFDLLRADGSSLPVLLSAAAVYDDAGRFVRSCAVVVSDPRRSVPEESLQNAYAELARRVDERTAELEAVIATLHDEIQDRERAEELLRQSEARAVAIVDAAVDGMITADEHGRLETINPAGEQMFGWSERDLLGRELMSLLTEPHRSEVREQLRRYRDGADRGILSSGYEMRGLRRDGTSFPLELAVSELRVGTRRLLHATVGDLSERKRAEARVLQLQQEVRRHEVMAAIGSLVAGFAHEARNPLFGISAVVDAFAARFGDRPEYAEHLGLLRRDVARLKDLMQDLLEFGRPGAALEPRPLAAALTEAVADCTALAETSGIAIEFPATLPAVRVAMNDRLSRAFQNLLQNAIQFSPRGSAVALEVALVTAPEGGAIECTVRDHGPGIAAEDLPHLFEPFFTRRRGGTGLGLAIVQRIVEEHRGGIVAGNHPDGGAAIAIRLPLGAPRAG